MEKLFACLFSSVFARFFFQLFTTFCRRMATEEDDLDAELAAWEGLGHGRFYMIFHIVSL